MAGLLFDFDPNEGGSMAFALTATGCWVLQRSEEGLELFVDETLDTVRPDGRRPLVPRWASRAAGRQARKRPSTERSCCSLRHRRVEGAIAVIAASIKGADGTYCFGSRERLVQDV